MYNHSHVFNFGFTIVSELLKKINLINSDIKTSTYYCSMIKRLFFSKIYSSMIKKLMHDLYPKV